MGRQPNKDNNLAISFANVAKEWHPQANGLLTPFDFLPFSSKKVWWICPEGHEYEAVIANRTSSNSGCPFCSGAKFTAANSFAVLHPEQASEWDYEKNAPLSPDGFAEFSGKKVWWKCKKGHEWLTTIAARSQQSNCPFCWKHTSIPEFQLLAELELVFGHVARRRKFSGLEVDLFIEKYQIGIEYDGSYWHRDKEKRDQKKRDGLTRLGIKLVRVREEPLKKLAELDVLTSARGLTKAVVDELLSNIKRYCHAADVKKIDEYLSKDTFQNERAFKKYRTDLPEPDLGSSLASQDKVLLSEFDYEKNYPLEPKHFSRGSQEVIWWRCLKGHSWETAILTRTVNKSGCPFCSRSLASQEFNLQAMFPKIAAQWHPSKNGRLLPSEVLPASNLKRWWICKEGHEWQAAVSSRTNSNSDCPYCAGSLPTIENNLAAIYPNVIKAWHPTKNKNIRPENILPSSGRKIWLLCSAGHEWQAVPNDIQSILKGEAADICQKCRKANNSLGRKFPELVRDWDFGKNSGIEPDTVSYGSKKKYWWRCAKGHSWEASPNQRTRPTSSGCPLCNNRAPYADIPITNENCLLATDSELCDEWGYELNGTVTPATVRRVCKDKVWWKCPEGHSWKAAINVRASKRTGCPMCARKVRATSRRNNSV